MNYRDQLGREVQIQESPKRIISLVPSQTELLSDLGLDEEIVGITRFCVHPPKWRKTKPSIGGTKQFNFKLIDELEPSLIIGNKEENYQEGIERLATKYPVWVSDIYNLDDAYAMMSQIGKITGTKEKADMIVSDIRSRFSAIQKKAPLSVLYLIWRKPWMAAGARTFINSILVELGLKNCLNDISRYPELNDGQIAALSPQIILLSSEPYPFREKHVLELAEVCPHARIVLVDGEMFSWYGSRLKLAADYFNSLDL
jgi:ABC-type Fe3+-hydroxamate transport system substrate-binding protein